MPRADDASLRRLAAEIDVERGRIDHATREAASAAEALATEQGSPSTQRLVLYAAAALLDTFYTGFEKVLERVARTLDGGTPEGPGWHRRLLETSAIAIPTVRPPVISAETARLMERYLSFRHRFRNLYLFDLEADPIRALLAEMPGAWTAAAADLESFSHLLLRLADGEPS